MNKCCLIVLLLICQSMWIAVIFLELIRLSKCSCFTLNMSCQHVMLCHEMISVLTSSCHTTHIVNITSALRVCMHLATDNWQVNSFWTISILFFSIFLSCGCQCQGITDVRSTLQLIIGRVAPVIWNLESIVKCERKIRAVRWWCDRLPVWRVMFVTGGVMLNLMWDYTWHNFWHLGCTSITY